MPFFTERTYASVSNPQPVVTGVVDGSNSTFTFVAPVNNLFLNQGFQTPGIDYTSTTNGNIVTVNFFVPPATGSTIYAT